MKAALDIQIATEADAAQIAAMNKQLIEDEGHRNPMDISALTARMAVWLGSGEYQAHLFSLGGAVIGYCLHKETADYVYLRQLFIAHEHRRRGLGRNAVARLRENTWQGKRLRVDVLTGNAAAIAFWRGAGFADYALTLELPPE